MKWIVQEENTVGDDLKKAFKNGEITLEDIEVIKIWVNQVEGFGPDSLSKTWSLAEATKTMDESKLSRPASDVNFWNDHELMGKWDGHRSSSFSKLGRIIYKITDGKIKLVKVMKITPTHDY